MVYIYAIKKILISQWRMYLDDIFSRYLSGYRTSYGCQDVLLHFINISKKSHAIYQ